MGASWFVRPSTRRLALSEDQWILVKQRLTAGEYRAHLKRSSAVGLDGIRRLNSIDHGLSLIVAYLVDWSLAEHAEIRGASESALIAVLEALDPDRFAEIHLAVETHEAAMAAERESEKNATAGEKGSAAISPSPSAAAGALSGSVT
jgi:hypothetical protein